MIVSETKRTFKTRILVQKGNEFVPLSIEDVAILYTHNRVVYLIDSEGKKHITGKNLNQLYAQLNKDMFFRANRQCIINFRFIKSFKTYERVRIRVELSLKNEPFPVIISQDNSAEFRKWINEEE